MELEFGLLPRLIILAVAMLLVYWLLYRKLVYSLIDPLFIFVFTTAFASVLVIEAVPEQRDVWHFFACQFGLWAGIAGAYNLKKGNDLMSVTDSSLFRFDSIPLLKWSTYALLCIYLLSNLIIANTKGFALLSDTPSESRVANFQAGFGVFQKINWGVGTFVGTSLIFLYLYTLKRQYLYPLLIVVVFTALDGSKSSLLRIVIAAGFVFYHPAFAQKRESVKKFQKFIPVALVGIMSVFFTVLLKENDGIDGAALAFVRRLLYSADTVLYFYTPQNLDYFANFSPLAYIDRLTNPILGFLRIQPYQEALGNIMVENIMPPSSTADVIVGPNTPFYIEGRIYFGFIGAVFYSSLIGYICGLIRLYYFSIMRSSAFFLVLVGSFCQFANKMVSDINLAITQSFDMFFFVLPIFVLTSLVLTDRIVFSRIQFWKPSPTSITHE